MHYTGHPSQAHHVFFLSFFFSSHSHSPSPPPTTIIFLNKKKKKKGNKNKRTTRQHLLKHKLKCISIQAIFHGHWPNAGTTQDNEHKDADCHLDLSKLVCSLLYLLFRSRSDSKGHINSSPKDAILNKRETEWNLFFPWLDQSEYGALVYT